MNDYLLEKTGNRTNLHILKTNIDTKEALFPIAYFFDSHPKIIKWTIDLEDVDKVLKILTTDQLEEHDIIKEIRDLGFYCNALD